MASLPFSRRPSGHRSRRVGLLTAGALAALGAALACALAAGPAGAAGKANPGAESAKSSDVHARVYVLKDGKLIAYGSSGILYTLPPSSYIPVGAALFAENCSACHGSDAQGTAAAPDLQGLGPATVDFWVSTGRMPATNPRDVQAPVKPPRLTKKQALEVAAWVNSLDPATPYIPHVKTQGADLTTGASLFALNCAACHTITGAGDALAYGTYAPSLHEAGQPTATQVVEAMRTGPGNMPRFDNGNLSDAQVRDITAYVVEKIQHPSNPGGFGLGGIGPVAEGFVALLFGVGGLMLICWWIGDRTRRGDYGDPDPHEELHGDGAGHDGHDAVPVGVVAGSEHEGEAPTAGSDDPQGGEGE